MHSYLSEIIHNTWTQAATNPASHTYSINNSLRLVAMAIKSWERRDFADFNVQFNQVRTECMKLVNEDQNDRLNQNEWAKLNRLKATLPNIMVDQEKYFLSSDVDYNGFRMVIITPNFSML